MEHNQKINCTVKSCRYNENDAEKCSLAQIVVTPIEDCDTCEPDESMCSSYEYKTNED